MLALNKTKAALQGRLSHFTNVTEENNTAISLVNLSRSAGAGNYGKSPGVTAAIARFHLSGGMRRWSTPQSPKFSGDLQSVEKPADTGLAEKPAVQPLGSIPRDCSSFRRTRFIQVARDESPSFFISASSCIRSSCWSRIWYWSVFALSLDIVITKSILSAGGCNYNVTEMVLQLLNTAKPRSARTLSGLLTKPLTGVTKMAGSQHTQTHPKFTWRFLALNASTCSVIHIDATTEREARDQSPAGCVMVFAGRLPVQGVSHA